MDGVGDGRVQPSRLRQQVDLAVELFLHHEGDVPEVRVKKDGRDHQAAEQDEDDSNSKALKIKFITINLSENGGDIFGRGLLKIFFSFFEKMGHSRPLSLYFCLFNTVDSKQYSINTLPMTGFEPQTSGVGSDPFAN